jgi:transaldolase
VLYVEGLVATGVVSTMPEATLRAFADHGVVRAGLDPDPDEPERVLRRAQDAGLDLARLTARVERDGVRSFADAYESVLAHIEDRVPDAARA